MCLKIKPTKTIQEKDGILKEQENILEWEKLPGKRKFGINNEYIYEDEEGIPKMKSNPYARKPQNTDKYEGMITQHMDFTKCQFTGEVLEVYKTMLNQNTPSFMRGELD